MTEYCIYCEMEVEAVRQESPWTKDPADYEEDLTTYCPECMRPVGEV